MSDYDRGLGMQLFAMFLAATLAVVGMVIVNS